MRNYAVIDIGATWLKWGIAQLESGRVDLKKFASKRVKGADFSGIKDSVTECLDIVLGKYSIRGVGISTSGFVDLDGLVRYGVAEGYSGVDWEEILASSLPAGAKICVLNDGQAAALGVARTWVGGTPGTLIHLVVGTGVGGGIVVANQLLRGATGLAGHVGHFWGGYGSEKCSCGGTGCVETFAGGAAIERRAEALFGRSVSISSIVSDSESVAKFLFEESGEALGASVACMVRLIDPAYITLGGGVIDAAWISGKNIYAMALERKLNSLALPGWPRINVQIASISNDASLYGMANFIHESES
ncbi:MAG: ROK family protein [Reyranellaceae bacterium]